VRVQGTGSWTAKVKILMQFIVKPIRTSIGRGLVSAKEHPTYGKQLTYPERMRGLELVLRGAAAGKAALKGKMWVKCRARRLRTMSACI